MKKLVKQALNLYDKQVTFSEQQIKKLQDELLIANAKLSVTTKLLEASETKRKELLKLLDTNKYKISDN